MKPNIFKEHLELYRLKKVFHEVVNSDFSAFDSCTSERHLITVGLGESYYKDAQRLARQANEAGWFKFIHIIDENSDVFNSKEILLSLNDFINSNPKGKGLWAWKSAILNNALKALPIDSHIYYIDAGCEISKFGSLRFKYFDDIISSRSALFFKLPFIEDNWTKPELLKQFPLSKGKNQIQATWFGLRNNNYSKKIVNRWYGLCFESNGIWLMDPDVDQLKPAIEHRHDQSILSCIINSEFRDLSIEPWEDYFSPWLYHANSEVLLEPIHALRSRNGKSILNSIVSKSTLTKCISSSLNIYSLRILFTRMSLFAYHYINDNIVYVKVLIKYTRNYSLKNVLPKIK